MSEKKRKKPQDSNFLLEQDENKYLGKQVVKVVFSFERMYERFRVLYPNCPYNSIIEERMSILHEIIGRLSSKVPNIDRTKIVLEMVLKFLWKIDKRLREYVEFEEKKNKGGGTYV